METTLITHLHPIYHIWFTWADPIITWATVAAAFTSPGLLFEGLIPPELASIRRDAGHDFLLCQMGGLYIPIALTATVLLRISKDVKVWNVTQASILLVDLVLIAISGRSLQTRGVLTSPSEWAASDYQGLGLTVWVAVLRACYLTGLGVKTQTVKAKLL